MASKSGTVYIENPKGQQDQGLEANKLDELAHRAGFIVFEISSHQPLIKSFRDKITICPNRITLLKQSLFSRDEYPMPIESVTNAKVFVHFMYASLTLETFGIPKPSPLKYLNINEARIARRYISAY